jgi:hypothetical protein
MWWFLSFTCLSCLKVWLCLPKLRLLSTFLPFSFPVVWCCLSFHGKVGFHFLCAESLEESFVVVALWSHIFLVSDYHGRLLLLHLLWMIVLLGRVSRGWSYFRLVPRRSHPMLFLLLMFLLRSLLRFWWFYLCMLLVFSLLCLQYSFPSFWSCVLFFFS